MHLIILAILTIITTLPLNGMVTHTTHHTLKGLNRSCQHMLQRKIFGIDSLVKAVDALTKKLDDNNHTLNRLDKIVNALQNKENITNIADEIIDTYIKKTEKKDSDKYRSLYNTIRHSNLSYAQKDNLISQIKTDDHAIKQYIQFVCSLPWGKATEDSLDIVQAREILDRDHYGLEEVKERVLEFMAIKKLNPHNSSLNALCLIGEPGIGKTAIAVSIAKAFNKRYQAVALSGASNSMFIKGNERGWHGAIPGRIINAIHLAQCNNPVILLDEIDKVSQSSHNGSPSAALLEVLDPQQNRFFTDTYVDIPFDLSNVLFIATANYKNQIPKELLNRMHIIELPSYTTEDKIQIAQRHLIKQVERETGLMQHPKHLLSLMTTETLTALINKYTDEHGVRELKQKLNRLAAHKAKFIVGDPSIQEPPVFTEDTLENYLGKAKNNKE